MKNNDQASVPDKTISNIPETYQAQTTENQEEMIVTPKKPPVESSTPQKLNMQWLLLVCFGLVVVATSVFGYIAYQNSQTTTKQPGSTQPASLPTPTLEPIPLPTITQDNPTYNVSLDVNTWKTFVSPLGFTFKYPSEWGDVKEQIADAEEEKAGDSGEIYSLTFSAINLENAGLDGLVFGTGRSPDYTAGRGGMDTDYRGSSESPKGVTATIWARPSSCIIPISSYSYFGRIDFNLPGKEIGGVRLLLPVISQSQQEIFDSEYDSLTDEEQNKECVFENIEKEARSYSTVLETKELDELSKKQLFVFTEILKSSSVQ